MPHQPDDWTFATITNTNVGATKKRRSEVNRNKTPTRQVLPRVSPVSLSICSVEEPVSPASLLRQTGRDFEACRASSTKLNNRQSQKTPTRNPPNTKSAPFGVTRMVGGGKRRHSEAEETVESSAPAIQADEDEGDEPDLRLMWERELSIGSGDKNRDVGQQHYRNLLLAPRKSASRHEEAEYCPQSTDECHEISEICRGSSSFPRTEGAMFHKSVSPISLFSSEVGDGASPSPPAFSTYEALSHFRQQSPFHRVLPPSVNATARASSIASNATSIATIRAKPTKRFTSPPCTTPPRAHSEMSDDAPPTNPALVESNCGARPRHGFRKATGARRKLDVIGEGVDGCLVNRTLEFSEGSVDPFLAEVAPELCNNPLESSVSPNPLKQNQVESVDWRAQADEWKSRAQAFFDELDQRPLQELEGTTNPTSRTRFL